MTPHKTKSKGVFLAIGWYLVLSEGCFLFYSVQGSSISHGWMLVITRMWNKERRQSKRCMFWGWQCKEASFWKREHTGCYSSWVGRHRMWVRPIHCLRKVIRPVAFGQTAWTSTMCKSGGGKKKTLRCWCVLPVIWRWNGLTSTVPSASFIYCDKQMCRQSLSSVIKPCDMT